jgi:hypothetical protein
MACAPLLTGFLQPLGLPRYLRRVHGPDEIIAMNPMPILDDLLDGMENKKR